jgi:hypothetical protein
MTMARFWLGICLLLGTRTAMYWTAVLVCILVTGMFMQGTGSLRAELDAVRSAAKPQNHSLSLPDPDSAELRSNERLEHFVSLLTPQNEYADLLFKIWERADREGVRAMHSDYRVERDLKGNFSKVMITMPVTAPYQTVKRYVFKLLAEHPGLALSKMEVKAGHLSANSIDAELTFTLFVSPP